VDGGAALDEQLRTVRRVRRAATVALVVVGLEAHLRTMERRGAPRTAVDHASARLCCHASGVRQHNVRDVEDAVRFLVGVTEHLAKLPYWPEEGYLTIFGALHAKRNRQIASVMDEEDGYVGHATYDDSQVAEPDSQMDGDGGDNADGGRRRRAHVVPSGKAMWGRALMVLAGCAEADTRAILAVYPSMAHLCAAYAQPGLSETCAASPPLPCSLHPPRTRINQAKPWSTCSCSSPEGVIPQPRFSSLAISANESPTAAHTPPSRLSWRDTRLCPCSSSSPDPSHT
jgi:hypothetical protein